MKKNKKQCLCALLLTGFVVAGTVCAVQALGGESVVFAQEVAFAETEIKETYYVGDTLTLPASITAEYNGTEYTLTDSVVYYPDGSAYQSQTYELSQTGIYKIVYSANVGGFILKAEKSVEVLKKNWSVGTESSRVEYGTTTMQHATWKGQDCLTVTIAEGDTFAYNVPIDLSRKTVNDVVTILPLQTADTANVQDVIVRLTDCYDSTNYVEFLLWYKEGNSTYARANASNQESNGLYKTETMKPVTGAKEVFVDGERYISYYSQWGVSLGNGAYANSDNGFTWTYNNDTQEVRVKHSRSEAEGAFVTCLNNTDIFGDNLFKGFTTGEVYLSLYANNYKNGNPSIEVAAVGNAKGAALESMDYTDKKAPLLDVDYTPTVGNSVFVAQGEEVEIFDATVMDISGAKLTTSVYYNYESSKRSSVFVKDGKFTATKPGTYTIVYTAVDSYGNTATEKVAINSVTKENGKAIDFAVEELTSITAGQMVTLPAPTVSGLNGDVTVDTYVTMPNGKTELIEGDSFTALYTGNYTFEYNYYDTVSSYTYAYTVTGEASESVRFLSPLSMPRYFIKDASYSLEDIKGYTFTASEPTTVDTTFFVKFDGGNYVETDVNNFVVEANTSVQVKYVSGGEVLESDVIPVVDTGFNATMAISQYFQGDFTAVEDYSYVRYTANTQKGDCAMQFVNALTVPEFRLDFTIPLGAAYKTLRLTLTDYYNRENKTVIDFTSQNGILVGIVDGVTYKGTGAFANNEIKSIFYNDSTKRLMLPNGASVPYQNSFTTSLCLLDAELVGINGEAYVDIRMVGNQPFGRTYFDVIEPIISAKNCSGQRMLNDKVVLQPAVYVDVLSPSLAGALCLKVIDSEGKVVTADDGTVLDGKADAAKEYTFTVTKYGNYRVTYTVDDQSLNPAFLPLLIVVADEIAPEVVITEQHITVPYLTEYTFNNFTVSDNVTPTEELKVTIAVYNDRFSVVSVGEKFEAKYAGNYVVYVYCSDAAGNSSYATFTLTVPESAVQNQ
jgi:hypothetical protein